MLDKVETTDTALIDELKGEVRVFRAYFYIHLASLFGDVPLVTTEITVEESEKVKDTGWRYGILFPTN